MCRSLVIKNNAHQSVTRSIVAAACTTRPTCNFSIYFVASTYEIITAAAVLNDLFKKLIKLVGYTHVCLEGRRTGLLSRVVDQGHAKSDPCRHLIKVTRR